MTQPVIYLDKSLLLNFAMDFIVLALTARLSGYKTSVWRLAVGALLGSLYILAIFLPNISFLYNMAVKIVFSCIITGVTFYPHTPRKFLVSTGYFYAITFAVGGAIYGFAALRTNLQVSGQYETILGLFQSTSDFVDLFIWGFPFALLFWLSLGNWIWRGFKRSVVQAVFRLPLTLVFGSVEVCLEGLVDTGNQLRDPLTRIPVVVLEASLLLPHLPVGFERYFSANLDPEGLEECLQGSHWGERLRLIPFISVGKQNGLMLGFVPDVLIINTPGGKVQTGKVIVGLYAEQLSPDGAYRALLHPDLLPAAG